jgi:hypothetical protein
MLFPRLKTLSLFLQINSVWKFPKSKYFYNLEGKYHNEGTSAVNQFFIYSLLSVLHHEKRNVCNKHSFFRVRKVLVSNVGWDIGYFLLTFISMLQCKVMSFYQQKELYLCKMGRWKNHRHYWSDVSTSIAHLFAINSAL